MPILTTEQHVSIVKALREEAIARTRPMEMVIRVTAFPNGTAEYLEAQVVQEPDNPSALQESITEAELAELPARELHLAGIWDCDHCGQETYVRSTRLEDPRLRETCGLAPDEAIDPATEQHRHLWPQAVQCHNCLAKFRVEGVV